MISLICLVLVAGTPSAWAADCDESLSLALHGNADAALVAAAPRLELTGDPISNFTRQVTAMMLHQSLDPGDAIVVTDVRHLSRAQILEIGYFEIVTRYSAAATLVKYGADAMLVEDAEPAALELIDALDLAPVQPNETYRFTLVDPAGTEAVSDVHTSPGGLEITTQASLDDMIAFFLPHAGPARDRAPAPGYRGDRLWLGMIHTHPVHEIRSVSYIEGSAGPCDLENVSHSALGPSDLDAAAIVSRVIKSAYYVTTAATLNRVQYTAIFKDGVNVTEAEAEEYLRMKAWTAARNAPGSGRRN